MIVKLSLLDRQASLHYSAIVNVALILNNYELIGTCRVFANEQGKHFGELILNSEVSGDLYFYYRSRANSDGVFWFDGLDLMENEISQNPTTQLKEMVVG